ncbi:hypothetical protein WT83_09845 [Burkholderia territorii]|uniref:Uncharacterized protein n=1 Tax=Burkholderia territorii TaxID=1503055 RepID=A0A108EZ85_9BURK|nr:hypothetical protein WT83_09845 [Burkholderia territorii]
MRERGLTRGERAIGGRAACAVRRRHGVPLTIGNVLEPARTQLAGLLHSDPENDTARRRDAVRAVAQA